MFIKFLGATQTVTGSKYLINAENVNLLVDCGLFQGQKELRLRNWSPLPIEPSKIDYILLTHAHIDHSGYIPLLVKNGFSGKIFCHEATRDMCAILLPDSGHLHEEEARYANLKGYSKHHPALPLYTQEEAEASIAYFKPLPFGKRFKLNDYLYFSFHYAGHILGAASIHIEHYNVSAFFSGDLGRSNDPIMKPPQKPIESLYYIIESTYGDSQHSEQRPEEQLGQLINRTEKRGGVVLIPAFAVGRAQLILYYIYQLKKKQLISDLPVYIDSPMATDATKLFYQFTSEHRLSKKESENVCKTANYIYHVNESMALDTFNSPMIIISASGMATGGRILHHIKRYGPDSRNAIVFCGFQASGTRGDRMVRGEKIVKMFGQMIPIAAEVIQLDNTSAHADQNEMMSWLSHLNNPPRKIFITHGEQGAAESLQARIEADYEWPCLIPDYLYEEELI